jgi:hypothetical protein
MHNRVLLILILFFFTKTTTACSCKVPNLYLEFYSSKYVFYGEIISKTYPKDSLNYTFTFKISKHYKNGDEPENLSFSWPSEARFRNEGFTSCDYDVNIGNKLLVFAQQKNEKLTFGLNCTNSTLNGLTKKDESRLINAKEFNLLNYHFNYDYTFFNNAKPITNIDSLIKPYSFKKYASITSGIIIMFNVDTAGNVTKSNIWETSNNQEINNIDSTITIFDIINKEYRKPKNDFEIDALEIAKNIKKWEVMRLKVNNKTVKSRQYISFSFDKNHMIRWKQFYFMIN